MDEKDVLLAVWKERLEAKQSPVELKKFKEFWRNIYSNNKKRSPQEKANLIDWLDKTLVVPSVGPLDTVVQMTQKYEPSERCNAQAVQYHVMSYMRVLSKLYKLGVCNIQQIVLDIRTGVVEKISIIRTILGAGGKTLSESIESCSKSGQRLAVISLYLNFPDRRLGHANMLIVDTVNKTVERFEPHGSETVIKEEKDINTLVDDTLTGFIEGHMPAGYSYVPPIVVCVRSSRGPQGYDVDTDKCKDDPTRGFCVVWTMVYAHLRLLSPGSTYDQLWTMLSKLSADSKFVRRYLALMEDVVYGQTMEPEKDLTNTVSVTPPPPGGSKVVKTIAL